MASNSIWYFVFNVHFNDPQIASSSIKTSIRQLETVLQTGCVIVHQYIWGNYTEFLKQDDKFFDGLQERSVKFVEVEYYVKYPV